MLSFFSESIFDTFIIQNQLLEKDFELLSFHYEIYSFNLHCLDGIQKLFGSKLTPLLTNHKPGSTTLASTYKILLLGKE